MIVPLNQLSASIVPAIVLFILLGVALMVRYRKRAQYRYPPGPQTLPILGNMHQFPIEYQAQKLAEWGQKYGDIVFANFFWTPTIILNSREAAEALLEKRSAKYSDRPRFTLLNEMMGWDHAVNLMPYGRRSRKHRKILLDALMVKSALVSYRPMVRRETALLLSGLRDDPDRNMDHLRRWSAALVFDLAYGHRPASVDDELVDLAERLTVETVVTGSPGSVLVDFFPLLKNVPAWIPGFGFKHQALHARLMLTELMDKPYNMVKDALYAGNARPSLTATLLEEAITRGTLTPEHVDDIKGIAVALLGAGSDTTFTAIKTFVLAMVLYPDVQKKAQEEIDRVVGSDRLPDFEDRDNLPYVEGVFKEVFRWNATVPLGIPHRSSGSDVFDGYDIPEGAMIMPNIWWMTQNPQIYDHPEMFSPDRYRGMSPEQLARTDPRSVVFGFGRRICPGKNFADASIWYAIANMIATMNISPAQDQYGRDIIPEPAFISGFISHPKPFTCQFSVRSDKAYALIE
uniref:Cytochrome P450 n=1 Tax=Polyporus umbellatus TaxID=158314 RepID=A0A168DB22_9APHY|nr:cytochrome P450 [Polyporus umbellatus]